MDVSGFLILLLQAIVYFAIMASVFHLREIIGIGVFFAVLGTMHFLETYLAAVFFVELPFGLISPGSTVMFAGKLAFFLLLYVKEDAESLRQPIYGLMIGNTAMVVLALILRAYSETATLPGYNPDLSFLDQIGFLMVWGTFLLFVDVIALVLIYERLGVMVSNTVLGRIFISLACVLSLDQVFFYAGLYIVSGVPVSAFYGGWLAKLGAAGVFSLMLTLYLRRNAEMTPRVRPREAGDVFDRLTYRHRYERLVEQVGRDPLTGLRDRGQFDAMGPAMLQAAAGSEQSVSLMMIDIDHFKAINDSHGHPRGDEIIRTVAETIMATKRDTDELFRYGGEEFALLSLETSSGAKALAERIRGAVASSRYPNLNQRVTISIGVASFPQHASGFPELVDRADVALYEAKALGRDRVIEARESSHTPDTTSPGSA